VVEWCYGKKLLNAIMGLFVKNLITEQIKYEVNEIKKIKYQLLLDRGIMRNIMWLRAAKFS
jgi:hypothetical protein